LNKREKRLLLPGLESKSLKLSFLEEPTLPIGEGGNSPIKDEIIALFPCFPRSQNEDFHEKARGVLLSSFLHHSEETHLGIPMDLQIVPTLLGEVTGEEQMEGGLLHIS
jgi:hypothetical protein